LRTHQTRRAWSGANFPLVMLIEIIHGHIISDCRITLCNGLHHLIFCLCHCFMAAFCQIIEGALF
jgi:hypothetical protein